MNYRLAAILILGMAAIGTGLGGHAQVPGGNSHTVVPMIAGNATQNPQFSEINVQVWGNYSQLDEYLFAPQGVVAPMLKDFIIHVNSPGPLNSTVQVTQGTVVMASSSGWAWNRTIYVNTTYSGIVALTINVTSQELSHTSSFRYILDFMSPVTYINYEHRKLNILSQVPLLWVSEAFAAGGIAVYAIAKMSRRLAIKPHVVAKHDEWGLIRSG